MDEWFSRRDSYLRAILSWESCEPSGACHLCRDKPGLWQCNDCLGNVLLCRGCCLSTHRRLPFHQIHYWTGTHFERDWLYNLGLVLFLGHHGDPCPRVLANPITV